MNSINDTYNSWTLDLCDYDLSFQKNFRYLPTLQLYMIDYDSQQMKWQSPQEDCTKP